MAENGYKNTREDMRDCVLDVLFFTDKMPWEAASMVVKPMLEMLSVRFSRALDGSLVWLDQAIKTQNTRAMLVFFFAALNMEPEMKTWLCEKAKPPLPSEKRIVFFSALSTLTNHLLAMEIDADQYLQRLMLCYVHETERYANVNTPLMNAAHVYAKRHYDAPPSFRAKQTTTQ
jgi:hypothetical protein